MLPPNQVWMPYQPQATMARSSAGSFAPCVPNEVRTSTAYGMPCLAPAWPISSIGTSTMALPSSTVTTACHGDMPCSVSPAASMYDAIFITMPTHSAAKWYHLQVRWATPVGARSSL